MKHLIALALLLCVSPVIGQDGIPLGFPESPHNETDWENKLLIKALTVWHANNPDLFASLEWTPEQKVKLAKTIESIKELDSRIADDAADHKARDQRKMLLRTMREELMDFQIHELRELRKATPIEAVLVSELATRHLELTDAQKKRIQDRSNRIGQEIREFMQKKRAEAVEVLKEELGMEQQEKLVALVGVERMNGFFQAPSPWLSWHLSVLSPYRDELAKAGWNFGNFDGSPKTFWK